MSAIEKLLTGNLAIWTSANNGKKLGRGRSSSNGDSVYGIKKLRELILELAVRGKLVPQDPKDEPASELLKRIQAEKVKLIAEGKIKKDKSLAPIMDNERPFELPQGWKWVRFADVCSYIQRGKGPVYVEKSHCTVISQKCVRWAGLDLSQARYIDPKSMGKYEEVRLLCEGDILWNSTGTGTIGRACCVTELEKNKILVADSHVTVVRSIILESTFLWRWIQSPSVQSEIEGVASGTTNQIELNTSTVISHLFPLPPLLEQHRIVAKIDELMTLCDQMETQYINAAEAHEKLVSHLLGTLTQSQSAEEFDENWHRIAAHFDTLFTTESSIDVLKQTILQLGVMGKLVPQDPNDEPSSELLKCIQAEKAKLIVTGKIKKEKPSPLITENQKPFDLPEGWEWLRLADLLALVTDGDHQAPPKSGTGVPFLVIGNLNTGNVTLEDCRFVPEEYYKKLDWSKKPIKNDILYTVTGSYGIPIKVDIRDRFCVQRHVAILKTVQSTPIDYLMLLLRSKYALRYAAEIATGIAQKTVPLTGLRLMPIAIPPFNEIQRIVSKVNELIAVCDQIKLRITERMQFQKKLAEVIVKQAVE